MVNYIYYVLVILGTVLFCIGLVFLVKKPFYQLATTVVKQLDNIINSSLNEEEKDRLLIENLFKLLGYFFLSLFLLFCCFLLGVLPIWIYDKLYPLETVDYTSMYFYLSLVVGSCSLFFLKNKKTSEYNYWSRLIHTIVLDNYHIGQYLFRKEIKPIAKNQIESNDVFVIVTGLARAGTTALTNLLYEPNVFHSISYANMPFLMAPNLWKKIYNPQKGIQKERAHNDSVSISTTAIEAFEEYFFKVFLNDNYIEEKTLKLHEVDEELYNNYISYQSLFKNKEKGDTIYLAKNNNFILRYKSLRRLNPNFKIILLFREPIAHAFSLRRQHENFTKRQLKDNFILDYMNWLGHYEFGLNHKEIDFNDGNVLLSDKNSLDYWLVIWINYYSYIIPFLKDKNLCLIHYEDLADEPSKVKRFLGGFLDISLKKIEQKAYKRKAERKEETINNDIENKAQNVYQTLLANKVVWGNKLQ